MNLQSPGPVLFQLGPLTIRWYGIMMAAGFGAASFAATKLAKKLDIDGEKVVNLALYCFIAGVIGARLYYVALNWPFFSNHLSEILISPSEGLSIRGLSIHGGIFGALIAGLIYCRKVNLPFLRSCDLVASVLPLGQAIGRWGNFFNSEAFGRPVDDSFPLKLFIPAQQRPLAFQGSEYFHPTFLYESIWDFLLFLVLYFVAPRQLQGYPGLTFFLYVAGYSVGRLVIEPLRTDSIMMPGMAIPAPTLISAVLLGCAVAGAGAILHRHRQATSPDDSKTNAGT
jgi:phosphatidylglycerol:prolipoprotein diacylglycerol transferase